MSVRPNLEQRVRLTVVKYRMLESVPNLGVAVSGGADSICLLHLLHRLAPEFSIRLHILHLNHQLRGAESELDSNFVEQMAQALGWPVTVERCDPTSEGGNLEQAGRDARRAFFLASRAKGLVDAVATGHTRSDQAETVLYRLLRGSGTAGLSGIQPVTSEGIVRPLFECTRTDVLEFLNGERLTWREDRSNQDFGFVRNRIRHVLLPLLASEFSPAVIDILAGTAAVARDEEDFWALRTEEVSREFFLKKLGSILMRADELSRFHPALARRVIRRAIAETKGDMRSIDLLHVERIVELAAQTEGHGRVQIPGLDIFRSFEWLRISRQRTESRSERDYSFPVQPESENALHFHLPGTALSMSLELQTLSSQRDSGAYNKDVDELDWGLLSGPFELRNWHPGDELKRPGRSSQKLKTMFLESRIPIWERQTWPVLTSGNEVVWAWRFGIAERLSLTDATRQVLRVQVSESDAGRIA